jgi:ribose transport system permease protein
MDKELKKPLIGEVAKGSLMQKLFAGGTLIFLYVFFGIFGENFFSVNSLISILNSSYYIGFIAIGMVFIIISGHIDPSA